MMGILALILANASAGMRPNQGIGQGMYEGMGPPSNPPMRRQGEPVEPSSAEAAGGTATSRPQAMTGDGMEHPTESLPLYRERTFLVLVGATTAAAGFFVYRVTRSRARRHRGPAGFLTEAVLVVDLVESTHLSTHYGDSLAMKARTILKDRSLAATEGRGLAFAESTGDGHLMTFPSVEGAVQTAIGLLQNLRDRPPDLSPGPPLEVRVGISYGEILLDGRGGRHGAVINRAFRLEGLTREKFTQIDSGVEQGQIPERNRIFLDEEATQELRATGIPTRCVGFCSLKGFSGLHRVYEVVWEDQG